MATLSLQELLNQLKDEKPKVRQQAVQGLGKLGDPAAIPQLVKVQQIDKDKGVKAEAKKALVKFRALEAAAQAPPDAPKTALLKKVRMALAVSLGVLILANVALLIFNQEEDPTYTPRDRQALIQEISLSFGEIREDATALQQEWGKIGQPSGQLDCSRRFKRPKAIRLSETDRYTYPDIATLVGESSRYQTNIGSLQNAFSLWDNYCRPDNPLPPGIDDANTNNALLDSILDSMPGLESTLTILISNPVATRNPSQCCSIPSGGGQDGPVAGNTPVPSITPVPAQSPTPLPNIDYATRLSELDALLVRANLVLSDMLTRYGTIQSGGFPDCNPPAIDQPYALSPDQAVDVLLNEAVQIVNNGLSALRQSVDLFVASCTREPQTALQQGAPLANQANEQFTLARQKIDDMKLRSGIQ